MTQATNNPLGTASLARYFANSPLDTGSDPISDSAAAISSSTLQPWDDPSTFNPGTNAGQWLASNMPNALSPDAEPQNGDNNGLEAVSLAIGAIGIDGELFKMGLPGLGAITSNFLSGVGSSVTKFSLGACVLIDTYQLAASDNAQAAWIHGINLAVDVGLSRAGLPGAALGVLWSATGGMNGAVNNPAINQNIEGSDCVVDASACPSLHAGKSVVAQLLEQPASLVEKCTARGIYRCHHSSGSAFYDHCRLYFYFN